MVLQAVINQNFDGEVVPPFLPLLRGFIPIEVELKPQFPQLAV